MVNGDAHKTFAVNICAVLVITLFLAMASLVFLGAALAITGIALPKTGQAATYAEGDDGEIQAGVDWPSPRFTDNGDGTITDSLTGLMWLKDANCFGRMRWQDGFSALAGFNNNPWDYDCQDYTADYTDWRLPNINELESLVNAGKAVNAAWLSENGFVNVQPDYYWSSTTMAKDNGDVSHAYVVGIWRGNIHAFNKTPDTLYILPVRAGHSHPSGNSRASIPQTGQLTSYEPGDDGDLQVGVVWPSPRFEDNGDGTVTDNLTGLMWLKDANCFGRGRWNNILNRVSDLNTTPAGCDCPEYVAGYTDWRLPNRKELLSLLDRGQIAPVLPSENPFTNVQSGYYWSSTSNRNGFPASVGMNNGYVQTSIYKNQSYYAWPVRTVQRPFPPNWPWRGVTLSMLGTNESDVKRLATDIKVNSIELSLNPRTVAKRHNISSEKAWEANLDWADKMLDACKVYGIVGIISFSEVPIDPYAGFDQTDPRFWNSAEMLDLTVSLAQTIAKRFAYRGNELAAYEILSEPVDRSNQKIAPEPWRQLCIRIVHAIRKIDSGRAIVVNPGPWAFPEGYKTFELIDDPNIIYGAHMYAPHIYTHQGIKQYKEMGIRYPGWIGSRYWDKKTIEEYFEPLIDFQQKHNVLMWIGEFSAIRWAPGGEEYLADCLDIFEKYGWGWAYHTYKGWQGWDPDYGDKYTTEKNVHEALVPWPSPRWRLLMKYFER